VTATNSSTGEAAVPEADDFSEVVQVIQFAAHALVSFSPDLSSIEHFLVLAIWCKLLHVITFDF
jgi:hypothetical protein